MDSYDRQDRPADFYLPDAVRTFVQHFYTAVLSGNVEEMRDLYRKDYVNNTKRFGCTYGLHAHMAHKCRLAIIRTHPGQKQM